MDKLSNDAPGVLDKRDGGAAAAPDPTEERLACELRAQAARCRRLAASIGDQQARTALERMAQEYDVKAAALAAPPLD